VVSDNGTKRKILEACHNDAVGGCHFGRDKTAAKVSARYYWKTLSNDVADWVRYVAVVDPCMNVCIYIYTYIVWKLHCHCDVIMIMPVIDCYR